MINLYREHPVLEKCRNNIENAKNIIIKTYTDSGKLLICGNGGSCADSGHIVGELMKGFLLKRRVGEDFCRRLTELGYDNAEYLGNNLQGALPAISLCDQAPILSAFANDVASDMVYAQMVYGYGQPNDLLIGISTSGNSTNVVNAVKIAKAMGIKTLALTGEAESKLSALCDVTINVPETETYRVQELHLPVYHYLCAETEEYFFKG